MATGAVARGADDENPGGPRGVGGAEAARAFGDEDAGGERVEPGRLEQFRGEVSAGARRDDDVDVLVPEHGRRAHVDRHVLAEVAGEDELGLEQVNHLDFDDDRLGKTRVEDAAEPGALCRPDAALPKGCSRS